MKINSVSGQRSSVNFGAARVNILSTADNHGNVHSLPKFVMTVETNKEDIFQNAEDESTLNIFAIVGDWYINPSKKGFFTKPKSTNGDIQFKFLKQVISLISETVGKKAKFETLFTMGNHDFDGGDSFVYKVLRNSPMKSLITNVDMDNSPGMKNCQDKSDGKVAKSFVFEIPDDKNPDLKHKVLFVGATIPTMDFYNPRLLKKMRFFDNANVKDTNLREQDIQKTIGAIAEEVDKFKAENPQGAVVLMSHMGDRLAKIVRDNVPQINVILNGHDHIAKTSLKGKTNINSLGKDNELIKALNLYFNDEGDLETIDMSTYFTDLTLSDDLAQHPLQLFLKDNFRKDMVPIVRITDPSCEVHELDYGNEIRYSNSYLANYLTSAVKRSVRKIDPEVFSVGIQSSIIRGGIKHKSNNLDLMKVFDGVSEDLSTLQIGSVSGDDVVGLITENIKANLKAPTRNTIIHWSDFQVDRTLISEIESGKSKKEYKDAIKARNPVSKEFEPIDPLKYYKIVLPDKFLIKDDIEWPAKIRDKFVPLNHTYDELFREYLDSVEYEIKITPKTREQRIL